MIIENGYKLDNSLIILALETLREQCQDAEDKENVEKINSELFKIRNHGR